MLSTVGNMVIRIAMVILPIELGIMIFLFGSAFDQTEFVKAMLDAILLTVIASPIIYYKVALPFVRASEDAQVRVEMALEEKSRQAAELKAALSSLELTSLENSDLSQSLQVANREYEQAIEGFLQRLGADLHDGPAQLLTFALLRLDHIALGTPQQQQLNHVKSYISEALSEVRRISTGLSVPGMEDWRLAELVAKAVERFTEHTGTRVEAFVDDAAAPRNLPDGLKLCIWRVLQECLSNSFRHAPGADIRVDVQSKNCLTIEVSDTGCGFEDDAARNGRLGLKGMRARVASSGGQIVVHSMLGEGTTVRFMFPEKSLLRKVDCDPPSGSQQSSPTHGISGS